MFFFANPITQMQRAKRIVNWNRQIIAALPPVPPRLAGLKAETLAYLRGRKRVFTDFAVAAEKVEAAILRSGIALGFQLEMEVRTLESLTLHEVVELYDFITSWVAKIPEVQGEYRVLLATLQQVREQIGRTQADVCQLGGATF